MYIVNAAGKVSAVDEAQAAKWLKKTGFRKATQKEVEHYQKEKLSFTQKAIKGTEYTVPLYFSSVHPNTDGYGVSSQLIKKEFVKLGANLVSDQSQATVGLLYHAPYVVSRLRTPVKILYTMFESDKIPADWHEYLEKVDLIITPSLFCYDTFKRAGYESKIVPLGYNKDDFTPFKRQTAWKQKRDFTILHYNAYNLRKGFREVLQAFSKAFSKTDAVKLILKTTLEHPPIKLPPSQYPNIKTVTGKMSTKQLVDLLQQSDLFLYPSRGEGFGIPPLEAMATGIPAIVPNAHGISHYFDSNFMYEAKIADTCPGIYARYKGQDTGKMVVCDTDQLADVMRKCYERQNETLAMGTKAAEYVQKYTIDKTAAKLLQIAEKYKDTNKTRNNYLKLIRI